MNINKKIFLIIGAILIIVLFYFVMSINQGTEDIKPEKRVTGDFVIWTLDNDSSKFQEFITEFKKAHKKYLNTTIKVESFSSYEDYFYTLVSAFNKGLGPDLFVLNSSEKSTLQEQVLGIDPSLISPNDFRKRYRGVFSDDLIEKTSDGRTEYLIGVPIGYESLGVFYNRRYFSGNDLKTWEGVNNVIYDLDKDGKKIVPIGIGNGSTVELAYEIITQLLALDGIEDIRKVSSSNIRQAILLYLSYGDEKLENAYNKALPSFSDKSNLDLFSSGDIAAIIGYPRTLKEIDTKGYNSKFLLAAPFPKYSVKSENKTFINYNYFTLSRDTSQVDLGMDLLEFMSTRQGAAAYLNNFPYYIPAIKALEDIVMEQKIDEDYNIVYKDFYDRETELVSFNKGIKTIYDRELINLLDAKDNQDDLFENLVEKLNCITNKSLSLTNLSSSCD